MCAVIVAVTGRSPSTPRTHPLCSVVCLKGYLTLLGTRVTGAEQRASANATLQRTGGTRDRSRPISGLQFTLRRRKLERRGQCDESNLRLLGQLLRVLARHDLLPHLARKRRRPALPQKGQKAAAVAVASQAVPQMPSRANGRQVSLACPVFPSSGSPPTKRQRRSRGRPSGGARRRRRGAPATPQQQQQQEPARPASEGKVTCGRCLRALVNACTEPVTGCTQGGRDRHSSGVWHTYPQLVGVAAQCDSSSKQAVITRAPQSYLAGRRSHCLLGSLLSGGWGRVSTWLQRLRVSSLRAVRLLVSVDEADYEAGRRRLLLMEEEGGRRPTEAS
ncbi:dna-binding death effector [Lynx pardinus]|uniref:Dna-binding death effector n=1 Tax=Lynx pardinus TaxID=191816 RepID=A0A485MEU8_LYNPA|nr:dna-binding death effector [Lynx pardinus]